MARFGMLLLAAAMAAGCAGSRGPQTESPGGTTVAPGTPAAQSTTPATGGKVHKLASGLVYEDLVVGNGKMADPGLTVSVHYTGWLTDGTKVDSSVDRDQPLEFSLGQGQVIRGWDEGIKGMRVGGKRKLTIPPDMGYGAQGSGDRVPPNATLVFDVELLGVK